MAYHVYTSQITFETKKSRLDNEITFQLKHKCVATSFNLKRGKFEYIKKKSCIDLFIDCIISTRLLNSNVNDVVIDKRHLFIDLLTNNKER